MRNPILSIFKWLVILLILSGIIQFAMIRFYASKIDLSIEPLQKPNPKAPFRVLFAGDSTGVGTGAANSLESTAGWFHQDFPNVHLENLSFNGLKIADLISVFSQYDGRKYDVLVLQIGANDLIQFRSEQQIQSDLKNLLKASEQMAKHIIILHCGDLGQSPLIFWPFKPLMTYRALKMRGIYLSSQTENIAYIDIYKRNQGKNFNGMYAPDRFHLNGQGYKIWYQYIKDTLQERRWLPS